MKLIECECCGSKDFHRTDGMAVCDNCGSKYFLNKDEQVSDKVLIAAEVHSLLYKSAECRTKCDYANEMSYLLQALRIDEKNSILWTRLGRTYRDMHSYKNAENCYKKAIALEPDLPYAYGNLGVLYMVGDDKRDADALEYMRKCMNYIRESDNDYVTMLANYGVALGLNGQKGEAVRMIRKAIKLGYPNGKAAMRIAGIGVFDRMCGLLHR